MTPREAVMRNLAMLQAGVMRNPIVNAIGLGNFARKVEVEKRVVAGESCFRERERERVRWQVIAIHILRTFIFLDIDGEFWLFAVISFALLMMPYKACGLGVLSPVVFES